MIEQAHKIQDYLIEWRRYFHQNPELSYGEVQTQQKILEELAGYPELEVKKMARTGIIADLRKGEGPAVAIRTDMDALPIQEQTGLSFQSQTDNVMHACGHDAHMAMLLAAVKLLYSEQFQGTIRFIFQPSEEGNDNDPEGLSGAERMVREGALEGIQAIIGQHQRPDLPAGYLGLQAGPVMATADSIEVTVQGKSAHAGAAPEKGIDAIVLAAQWINAIQSIISRKIGPAETAVLSIGKINGGSARNIIADEVRMSGTLRTLSTETRNKVMQELDRLSTHLGAMHHTTIQNELTQSLPLTFNDSGLYELSLEVGKQLLPGDHILYEVGMMAAEDFSFYGAEIPAFFGFLGTGAENGPAPYGLHHPKMVLNEDALPVGAAFLSGLALNILEKFGSN